MKNKFISKASVSKALNYFLQPIEIIIVTYEYDDANLQQDKILGTTIKNIQGVIQHHKASKNFLTTQTDFQYQYITAHFKNKVAELNNNLTKNNYNRILYNNLYFKVVEFLNHTSYGYVKYLCIEDESFKKEVINFTS